MSRPSRIIKPSQDQASLAAHHLWLPPVQPKSKVLALAVASFLIASVSACMQSETLTEPMMNKADLVQSGMTREQVFAVLGPWQAVTTSLDFPPDCVSWAYDANGTTKYIHVQYRYDMPDGSSEPRTVISVSDDQRYHCAIE